MEIKIDINNLTDDQQERMCELCELNIIECCSNSSTFQCEGCRCDEALEYLIENLEESNNTKLIYKIQCR